MVELGQVVTALADAGLRPDPQMVSVVFATIDRAELEEQAGERVRYELWDHESDINGAPAADIKARNDYVGGEVYLVYVDDRLSMIQPSAPGVPGFVAMDEAAARRYAEAQVAEITDHLALVAVLAKVRDVLVEARVIGDTAGPVG